MSQTHKATFPDPLEPFITSWSGGKDACFALWHARQRGARAAALFTMMNESGESSLSHGLPRKIIEAQARALGLPVMFRPVARGQYEKQLRDVITTAQKEFKATSIVYGDIDLDAHKTWYEGICAEAAISPRFPLWRYSRQALLDDVLSAGFQTMIVSLQPDKMDRRFLGQVMSRELADEIQSLGICPSGEDGEFHSLVLNGPAFTSSLSIKAGKIREDDYGHAILDISLNT